jgi:PAS domain S-box-containing protein
VSDKPGLQLNWRRVLRSASLVTVAAAIVLELLAHTPFNIPNPSVVLIFTVVYAAFLEGPASGLVSAAIAVAYALHYSISGHSGVPHTTADARRDVVVAIVLPATAMLVGILRNRLNQALQEEQTQRETADRERSRSYRILDTISEGFITLTPDWQITYANQSAEQILGRPRNDLIGLDALTIFPAALGDSIHEALEGALAARIPIELEDHSAPADRWFEVRVYPMEDQFHVYVRDVSSRRRAQEGVRFQTRLLDAIGQAVIATDLDGVIVYWNRAAEVLFGWPAAEVISKAGIAMTHANHGDSDELILSTRLRGGRAWLGEAEMKSKSGSTFAAAIADTPIVGDNGTLIGMVRVVTDLTWRKSVEEQQRFLSEAGAALADTLDTDSTIRTIARLPVPGLADCCLVDLVEPDGRIRRLEQQLFEPIRDETAQVIQRRYPVDAGSNHPIADVIRSGEPRLIHRMSDQLLRSIAFDSQQLGAIREARFRSAMIVPLLAHGRNLGALSLLSARSDREYTNSDLALAEELAGRAAVALENAQLYETAIVASRAKSDFLAVMSHELRTPLTTIMGYTDLLLAGVPRPVDEPTRSYIERVRTAAWHLLGIIEQILVYARLEAGREEVNPSRLNVEDLLRDAAILIEPVAMEKGLTFKVMSSPPVTIETDLTMVRQILLNLLSNAVKFTEKGDVTLEAYSDASQVTFNVRDTGIGIAPEFMEKVFDPFWQVDQSSTRHVGGTGLGLSVVRRLARLLGGDATVRSSPGAGAVFSVSLPLRWRLREPVDEEDEGMGKGKGKDEGKGVGMGVGS